jgi:hypothetical protein
MALLRSDRRGRLVSTRGRIPIRPYDPIPEPLVTARQAEQAPAWGQTNERPIAIRPDSFVELACTLPPLPFAGEGRGEGGAADRRSTATVRYRPNPVLREPQDTIGTGRASPAYGSWQKSGILRKGRRGRLVSTRGRIPIRPYGLIPETIVAEWTGRANPAPTSLRRPWPAP